MSRVDLAKVQLVASWSGFSSNNVTTPLVLNTFNDQLVHLVQKKQNKVIMYLKKGHVCVRLLMRRIANAWSGVRFLRGNILGQSQGL